MKTTFLGLLVLIQLILQPTKNAADVLSHNRARTFYIIGHMANEITQVEKHLADGANALEIDVQFSAGGRPIRTNHGFPCCFLNCFMSDVFNYMLQYLRDLSTPEHPTYTQQLALIKMDLRVRSFSNDMLYVAGERLAEALMVYLFDGGFSGSNIWVLLSVPSPEQVILFQGLRDAFRRYQMAGLLDKIGYTIGDNSDLLTILRSLDHLGITDHIWIGDGSSRCLGGLRSRDRLERIIEERDIGEGHFDSIYHYTVDDSLPMRNSLRLGIDALVTNRPDRLLEILSEDEFYGRFRLATADDRPWDKVIDPEFPILTASDNIDDTSAGEQGSSSLVLEPTNLESLSLGEDGLETRDCKSTKNGATSTNTEKETDISETTTAKIDEEDLLSKLLETDILSETPSNKSERSLHKLTSRSSEIEQIVSKIAENKETKLTSDLVDLISKLSATPATPTIPISALETILNLRTATQTPTIPVSALHALLPSYSSSNNNILRILGGVSAPEPRISQDALRVFLNLYATTPSPGIPLHIAHEFLGLLAPTTPPTPNLDLLKILTGTGSEVSFGNNNAVLIEVIKILAKANAEKSSGSEKDTLPEVDMVEDEQTSKKKSSGSEKGKLTGKEEDNDDKAKDSTENLLKDVPELDDIETTTEKTKPLNTAENLTRNFPIEGGPPIPPFPGTTVIATVGPGGIHWKLVEKPNPIGSPFGPSHPFPFPEQNFFNNRPSAFGNGVFRPLGVPPGLLPSNFPYLNIPAGRPNGYKRPIFQASLPSKITIHNPINIHKPPSYPVRSVGHQIRLPNRINIHLPVSSSPQNSYSQKPYTHIRNTTPYPIAIGYQQTDQHVYHQTEQHVHHKPTRPDKPNILFPAIKPPVVPGIHHSQLKPSGNPFPQRPFFPPQSIPADDGLFDGSNEAVFVPQEPVFEEPPVFFDTIHSLEDFLKSSNISKQIPKDLFSSVQGVRETNISTSVNVLNKGNLTEEFSSEIALENFKEITDIGGRQATTTTVKPIEDPSFGDIVEEFDLKESSKGTPTSDPFEELMSAFEKLKNDEEAVQRFLKRVNLTSPTSKQDIKSITNVESSEPNISTLIPGKSSLTQIFNMPPTAGLGWNGQDIDQIKLQALLAKDKQSKQQLDVVVIENSPLIFVPPDTVTKWPDPDGHTTIQKRETTPPPDEEDYMDYIDLASPITHRRPDTITKRPLRRPLQRPITISKPSEGLKKNEEETPGKNSELKNGELEIIIPSELFTQKSTPVKENKEMINDNFQKEKPNEDLEEIEKVTLLQENKKGTEHVGTVRHKTNKTDEMEFIAVPANKETNNTDVVKSVEREVLERAERVASTRKLDFIVKEKTELVNATTERVQGNSKFQAQSEVKSETNQAGIPNSQRVVFPWDSFEKQKSSHEESFKQPTQHLNVNVFVVTSSPPHQIPEIGYVKSFKSTQLPSTTTIPSQRRFSGVSLRHPNVPLIPIISANPTTPYPRRVFQRLTTKRPNVSVHYRGSGSPSEKLDGDVATTAFPLLQSNLKAQLHQLQAEREQRNSQRRHLKTISSQLSDLSKSKNSFAFVSNETKTPQAFNVRENNFFTENSNPKLHLRQSAVNLEERSQKLNATFLPRIHSRDLAVRKKIMAASGKQIKV